MKAKLFILPLVFTLSSLRGEGEKPGEKPGERPGEMPRPGRVVETPEQLKRKLERQEREREEAKRREERGETAPHSITEGVIGTGGTATPRTVPEVKDHGGKATPLKKNPYFTGKAKPTAEGIEQRTRAAFKDAPNVEEIVKVQKEMIEAVKGDPLTLEGVLAREQAMLDALQGKKEMGTKEAKEFERLLLVRLKGTREQVRREDVSIAQKLACPAYCGSPATKKPCRRLTLFLGATATLGLAAFNAAWKQFSSKDDASMQNERVQLDLSEFDVRPPIVIDLSKEVPEEKLTPVRTSS